MIAIDTSALVHCFCGDRRAFPRLEALVHAGERIRLPTLVLYEWRRGPRTPEQLALQEDLFPSSGALAFDSEAAIIAADLFVQLGKPRRRQADLAIAATALASGASLWTLNERDFQDVPGIELVAN